jgi:FkbM family methyltransferase
MLLRHATNVDGLRRERERALMDPETWRPYSRRSAIARQFIPDIDFTVSVADGLRLKANLKTHCGLFRRRIRQREIATARAIAAHAPGAGVIYDLGANIGLYTLVFASDPRRRVISVEPSTLVLPYLRHNIDLNALRNVQVQPVVLSDRRATLRFTLDETTTCTSHVSAPEEDGMVVACTDLDSLIEHDGLPPPDLIKLDVEGHDEPILKGASGTLAKSRPVICLEGGLRTGDGQIASLQYLKDAGYSLWDLARRYELATNTSEYVVVAVPNELQ